MKCPKPLFPLLAAAAIFALSPLEAAPAENPLASLQFQSGGVGAENRLTKPAGYPAKLVFVNEKGEYFAGVQVRFRKEGKTRLVRSRGPWLWVKGAPGEYRVEARSGEASAQRRIALPEKGTRTIIFRLKRKPGLQ